MIPEDKQRHLAGGALIAFTLAHFFNPAIGFVAAIIAGAGKEIYDGMRPDKHTQEFADFFATVVGGLFAYSVLML